jgi:hypothetical protein
VSCPSLAVRGLSVQVITGPLEEGVPYRYVNLPQPTLIVPDSSDEVIGRSMFEFLHAQCVETALPAAVGGSLFGMLRDNPAAFRFLMQAEPPADAWVAAQGLGLD